MKHATRIIGATVAIVFLVSYQGASARQDKTSESDVVAKRADLYCTGFISDRHPRVGPQIVGGEKENSRSLFVEGDVVFVDRGREAGVQPGAVYYVIRPLGEVRHPSTNKRMGVLVRELGMLRVIEVHDKTATAEITVSCDSIEMGDLLRPYEAITSPEPRDSRPLPRYGEGSGGRVGQIVMSPTYREYLAAHQVVYIDLGERHGVRAGDYFTIFRQTGRTEGVTKVPEDNILQKRNKEYGSKRYNGGDYSIYATRKPRGEVFKERPQVPRKVLGELVVIKVDRSASVGLITRTTAEVNIGDFVEHSN